MKKLSEIFLKKKNTSKEDSKNIKNDISTVKEDVVTIEPKEGEYDIVEIEILPEKMICPDCGGITLVGLDFCDKCGGELSNYES
jgi:hypothetical protein